METPQTPYESKKSSDAPLPSMGSSPVPEQPTPPTLKLPPSPRLRWTGRRAGSSKTKVFIGVMVVLIVVLTIGAFILGSRISVITINGPPYPPDEASCIQHGGKWVSVDSPDISQKCSLPTSDSGTTCTDNGLCESGLCIADANGKGTCYGWTERPPCFTSMIGGEVQPEACMDTAPGDTPGSAPASDGSTPPSLDRTEPPGDTSITNIGKACAVQGCHGLDITCGPVPPNIMCTKEYQMGDKCREFASCEVVNGVCQQTASTKFTQCKECAEQCQKITDPIASFQCERGC